LARSTFLQNYRDGTVTAGNMTGYHRNDFDLKRHWNDICITINNRDPFYALKDWRKVFRLVLSQDNVIYIKIVDERFHDKSSPLKRLFSTEASRYFSAYRMFKQIDISTPELLFTLGEKRGLFWTKSIMGTKELKNHVAFTEYFVNTYLEKPNLKEMILQETACLTARLHSLGFYFSMNGQNILIRRPYLEGENNISLIDLDHVKKSIFLKIPERRRKRNLERLKSTMKETAGLVESDYEIFLSHYNGYFYSNKNRHH